MGTRAARTTSRWQQRWCESTVRHGIAALDALLTGRVEFLSDIGSIALDDRSGSNYATRQLESDLEELHRLETDGINEIGSRPHPRNWTLRP